MIAAALSLAGGEPAIWKGARVIIEVGGSAFYEVNPSSFRVLAHVECKPVAYSKKADGDLPSCHSQLYFMQGKSGYYPYADTEYVGVDGAEFMPGPVRWDTWNNGTEGCDQGADRVCKKRVECSMNQAYYSSTVPFAFGGQLVMVSSQWKESAYRYLPLSTGRCTMCVPTDCADASCGNGQLAAQPPAAHGAEHNVYQRPYCVDRACAKGTWLTCNSGLSCSYQVPNSFHVSAGAEGKREWFRLNKYKQRAASDLNIVEAWPLPSGSCYPCNLANRRDHYGVNVETPEPLFRGGFLSYYCPGGADAPAMCGANMVTRVDNATGVSGDCACKDGYYWDATAQGCAICPAGHYCRWSGMTPPAKAECPQDQYALEGWSECRPCNTAYQMCDRNMALRRCLPGENGRFQSGDATCIPCSICKQVTNAEGSMPCYRVTSALNDTLNG
jgi:hypothetical protein